MHASATTWPQRRGRRQDREQQSYQREEHCSLALSAACRTDMDPPPRLPQPATASLETAGDRGNSVRTSAAASNSAADAAALRSVAASAAAPAMSASSSTPAAAAPIETGTETAVQMDVDAAAALAAPQSAALIAAAGGVDEAPPVASSAAASPARASGHRESHIGFTRTRTFYRIIHSIGVCFPRLQTAHARKRVQECLLTERCYACSPFCCCVRPILTYAS
jgi:hypothetical protein